MLGQVIILLMCPSTDCEMISFHLRPSPPHLTNSQVSFLLFHFCLAKLRSFSIWKCKANHFTEFPDILLKVLNWVSLKKLLLIEFDFSGSSENSIDSLVFETLVPKSILQRYISLLMEHRRMILCGPSGTGKTYLAQKLAEYLIQVWVCRKTPH